MKLCDKGDIISEQMLAQEECIEYDHDKFTEDFQLLTHVFLIIYRFKRY